MSFPPSPVLSICDSLADIDDLDAFLDSQPALSHFPTPPMNDIDCPATPIDDCQSTSRELDYLFIAQILAEVAGVSGTSTAADIDAIFSILLHAQLPDEILAIAWNFLAALSTGSEAKQSARDITVVAALNLAVSYSADHAPSLAWWSQRICQGSCSAADINQAAMKIYAALGWNLHRYAETDAVAETMASFSQHSTSPLPIASLAVEKLPALVRTISIASSG